MLLGISKKESDLILSIPDFKQLSIAGSSDKDWQESLFLFIDLLYRNGFFQRFDWQTVFAGKEQYLSEVTVLKTMSLEEIRRVLTAHVRLDRLCEGHLNTLAESGYLEHLVKRLKVLNS